jgi:hypothetical protein
MYHFTFPVSASIKSWLISVGEWDLHWWRIRCAVGLGSVRSARKWSTSEIPADSHACCTAEPEMQGELIVAPRLGQS